MHMKCVSKYQNGTPKVARKAFNMRRSGTQYFAMVICLDKKEIFENSKQHFSSHADYMFMFQNGLDRKDAIFVVVPL